MAETVLERIQRLCGPHWNVTYENGRYVFKPSVWCDIKLSSRELDMDDREFAEEVLAPILQNVEDCLSCDRPYHLNTHERYIADLRRNGL